MLNCSDRPAACIYIHTHTLTEEMMQHFIRCFPWYSCHRQLQLGPQSTRHTLKHRKSLGLTHVPITYIRDKALNYAHCINPRSSITLLSINCNDSESVYWRPSVCISLYSVYDHSEAVFSFYKEVQHFLSFPSLQPCTCGNHTERKHRPSWERVRVCMCGVGVRPKEPVYELTYIQYN